MKTKLILFTVFSLLLGGVGCEKKTEFSDIITTEATIVDTSIGDHCDAYMIIIGGIDDVNSIWYKPENLPEKFKVNGLKVKINYTLTDENHNCGFGGYKSVIIIHKIERILK